LQESQAARLGASAKIYVQNAKRFRDGLRQTDYDPGRGFDIKEPLD
jgi:hypothetical protein